VIQTWSLNPRRNVRIHIASFAAMKNKSHIFEFALDRAPCFEMARTLCVYSAMK